MSHELRDTLLRQFDIAWALTEYHLNGLTTEESLWRPAARGLHVQEHDGEWRADWPEHEGYDPGPASMAWLTWHMIFWWSLVLDHSFGEGKLTREQVLWPHTAEAAKTRITQLQTAWRERVETLTDEDLRSSARTRWPFQDKPFAEVLAWLNIELTKNAAELGYARFLHAVRH